MTTISLVSAYRTVTTRDRSLTAIALFCCCGLIVSFGLLTYGVNLAPDWV
ncbi:hypothetical protein [Bradyrhizobium sp.]|nr:hypothetical protein [Bradyrhizobium sp.]MBV8916827.1 hypothetical protein [Bradyrhizobium sp.]MBV9982504.1 hypothetical protein [Bradyrhizobium sp.]